MFTNVPLNAMRPTRWERLEEDRFYIGSHLAGTLIGDRERGYLINYPDSTGNGYAPNLTRALRKMRVVFWASRGL